MAKTKIMAECQWCEKQFDISHLAHKKGRKPEFCKRPICVKERLADGQKRYAAQFKKD